MHIHRTGILVSLGIGACSTQGGERPMAVERRLDEVVVWERSISLEENARVINVSPRVRVDTSGYLVADMKEYQVRQYRLDGTLTRTVGAHGTGPGEFSTSPMAAGLLADGSMIVSEFSGRLSTFDSLGQVTGTAVTSLIPLYGFVGLDRETLLLMGRGPNRADTRLLHVWDTGEQTVTARLFPVPRVRPSLASVVWMVGHAHATQRDSLVIAVFATDPAVHLFGLGSTEHRRVPLPSRHFRDVHDPPPRVNARAVQQWLQSFSRLSEVFWTGGDTLLLQYYDMEGSTVRWNLLAMTLGGRGLFEVEDTPRLLAVDDAGRLVFVDPEAMVPNRWRVGRLGSSLPS